MVIVVCLCIVSGNECGGLNCDNRRDRSCETSDVERLEKLSRSKFPIPQFMTSSFVRAGPSLSEYGCCSKFTSVSCNVMRA